MSGTFNSRTFKIGIRVDGGHSLGLGHIYKSLWLAEYLVSKGCELKFLVTEDPVVKFFFGTKTYSVEWLSSQWDESRKIEFVNQWIGRNRPAAFIIDHWDWPDVYWKQMDTPRETIFVAVDVPPEGFGKFNLAFQGIRNSLKNIEYIKEGCEVFEGPKYLMVSPGISGYIEGWQPPAVLEKVLLTFGGTDVADFSLKVLDRFQKIPGRFQLILVTGPGSINYEAVVEKASCSPHDVEVLREVSDLPARMCQSHLAVTTAGLGTLSELALTGTPAIVLAAVDHQVENARKFASTGGLVNCAHSAGSVDEAFEDCFFSLVNDPKRLDTMSCNLRGLVDGKGIKRMSSIILQWIQQK